MTEKEEEASKPVSIDAQLKQIQTDIATAKAEIIEALNNVFRELKKILTDEQW